MRRDKKRGKTRSEREEEGSTYLGYQVRIPLWIPNELLQEYVKKIKLN